MIIILNIHCMITTHVKISRHGQIMMKMSVLMNCMIPLMCHFMYKRGVTNTTEFILSVYDILIDLYDVDVYNKLYETAISNVLRTAKRNQTIWNMQDIRGINTSIHSLQSVQNVLINIMPKYLYSGNLVHLNYKSILRNTGFQVLDRFMSLYAVMYIANLFNCWKAKGEVLC